MEFVELARRHSVTTDQLAVMAIAASSILYRARHTGNDRMRVPMGGALRYYKREVEQLARKGDLLKHSALFGEYDVTDLGCMLPIDCGVREFADRVSIGPVSELAQTTKGLLHIRAQALVKEYRDSRRRYRFVVSEHGKQRDGAIYLPNEIDSVERVRQARDAIRRQVGGSAAMRVMSIRADATVAA